MVELALVRCGVQAPIMELLSRSSLRCKFALLPDGAQPDTVDVGFLRELFGLDLLGLRS